MELWVTFSTTITVVVVIINILLAIFVYKNNPKSATNKIFTLLGVVTSVWVLMMYASNEPVFFEHILFFSRLTLFFAVPYVTLFYLLAETLPSNKITIKKSYIYFLIVETVFMMCFAISSYVFEDMYVKNGVLTQTLGPGIVVFVVFMISFSLGIFYSLISKVKSSYGIVRQQFIFIFIGVVSMFMLIIVTILIPVMLYENMFFIKFTPLYVLLFLGMTAYAIIKHKFLDVRFVLVRTISYMMLILSITVLYAGVMLVFAIQFFEFDFDSKFLALVIVVTTFITLSFGQLSKYMKHFTDKVFFKGEYDTRQLLTQLTHVMAHTIDLGQMTNSILNILVKNMRLTRVAFLVLEEHKLADINNVNTEGKPYVLLEEEFEQLRGYVHREEGQNVEAFVFRDMEEGEYKKVFRKVGISIAIPVRVKNECIAILLLDEKRSGEIYTPRDINFLEIFAAEAGIAIQNAKSYERIKQFSEELEDRVEQRTKELKEAQRSELKRAQDVARLKDEFVFIATHELRAPITAIRLFLEMMPSAKGFFPADVQEKLDSINQASNHLNQLINDLLEIARSEAEPLKIDVKPIDVSAIIKLQIQELASVAEKKKVTISFVLPREIPKVMSDVKKITEVITNLVSNAIKYNREGGKIDINAFERENDIVFEIKDTGFGIPKDQQGKIFQKFFRASSKNTLDVLGTGLGLFITRMLVEKMGGKIRFTSVQGKGTTFTFSLPKEKI